MVVHFANRTKTRPLLPFPLIRAHTYTHVRTKAAVYVHDSALAHHPPPPSLRPSLIYSPSEVDDFRYFSSAVSSKQLPFPNVHPAHKPDRFGSFRRSLLLGYPLNRARTSIGPAAALRGTGISHLRNVRKTRALATKIIGERSRAKQKSATVYRATWRSILFF